MISIIIPVYNQAKKLSLTLASIASQSLRDWEVIVVNDGSNDNPEAVFADFCAQTKIDNRFLFLSQENQGAPAARNRGYQEAAGEYLFFCDADADLQPDALEIMLQTLNDNPDASYAYPSFLWGKKLFKVGPFDVKRLQAGPYIHTMALIRRSDFPAGGWDESIRKFQDWDLWLTMMEAGKKGVWIDRVLFKIAPGGSISSWLPSFAYKLLPFLPAVKKYRQALAIIKKKHVLA
ncbi:MAG: glycosyltransferase family A protein [Patescibacteria group bacterium]|nr:glycosyltransferase family A protein [Patescibacteria group bacterium]